LQEIDRVIARFSPAAVELLTGHMGLTVPEAAVVLLRVGLAGVHSIERFYPEELGAVLRLGQMGMDPWRVVRVMGSG
jgi:hypothetical protein